MTGAPPPLQSRTWTWTFDRPVAAIWPAMADTARFNEAAGLPKHTIAEVAQPDGSVRYLATAHKGSIPLAWEDFPVNWVAGRWMRHRRVFSQGPLAELIATLRFAETDGGCTLDYTLEAAPANWLGRLALATKFFSSAEANFTALADQARSYARGERPTPFNVPVPTLPEGAADRAHTLAGQIEATEHGHGLAGRLADLVLTGSEVDLWTIRPLSLARAWTVPERHAVEVCLEAVAQGLLRLRWDLVCPRCRVGKGSVPAMDQLPKGAHCPSCNIRYDRDYLRNVELAFHPATAIRQIAGGEYCLFGPMSTPHVKAQVTLDPGETRDEPLDLPPGP
ncbi:MAG: hypothetical protein KDE22_09455, partial [Rhodobacterales bacterium]|nr:hypothetical protein [Rhodobacterales bacterium]